MRPVERRKFPFMHQRRPAEFRQRLLMHRVLRAGAIDAQHVARFKRARRMTAEAAEREGRAGAQIFRRVEAVADREIGALSRAFDGAEFERLSTLHLEGLPVGHGLPAHRCGHLRTGKHDEGVGAEMQRRPGQRHFEGRRAGLIADEPIRELEGQRIHRPRGRHADVPIADPARIILDRRLRARRDDVDGRGLKGEMGERRGAHRAVEKRPGAGELAQIVEIGLDAVDGALIERRGELRRSFCACRALDDDFRQHRIVEGRDLCAGCDPPVDAHAVGETHLRQQSGGRLEIPCRIFGIETHLDRMTLRLATVGFERRKIAGGLRHHHLDEIETGHLLGHRMLDLKPRVDFEEVEFFLRRIIDEFDRAGGFVGHRLAEPHRRLVQRMTHIIGKIGCRRLLDHLLVAPLRRAVAFAERDHIARTVAEDLHLDVPRLGNELLEEHAAILEIRKAEALHRFEETRQFGCRPAELQADAAAARGAFEHHGIADALAMSDRVVEIGDERRTRQQWYAALLGEIAGRMLQREGKHVLRPRPDKGDALVVERLREARILAEKTVARMDGLGARRDRGGDDRIGIEIALRDHRRADADRFVGEIDMRRETVGLRIDGDGSDAHEPERANDAAGDLAAIRNQDFLEHCFLPERQPFQMSVRMGVGLKSLQGLLTCGQFEMTQSTSISARNST